jgi:two-component system, chemotaxis family, protein-glutamate methylesterase/glutaminase
MIRTLVVDDSASARASIVAILRADDTIELVGEARDGVEALELTKKLQPDVITMDIEMPRLDGFEATREIMIEQPTPIVVISAMSRVTEAEAAARALGAGALAVLRKPPGPTNVDYERAAHELRETIKAMADVKVVRRIRAPRAPLRMLPNLHAERARVIAIAASTGGPAALEAILAALPRDSSVPILIVQHIASGFAGGLATWLARSTGHRVKLAESGEPLRPGTIYVAPDDLHLGASPERTVVLSAEPPIGGFRPSGTYLFRSVAETYGRATVAVILTGMGRDGVDGLRVVRQAGGRVIAQDEETSVVFGMPGAAVAERLADVVLPIEAIAPKLTEATRSRH